MSDWPDATYVAKFIHIWSSCYVASIISFHFAFDVYTIVFPETIMQHLIPVQLREAHEYNHMLASMEALGNILALAYLCLPTCLLTAGLF